MVGCQVRPMLGPLARPFVSRRDMAARLSIHAATGMSGLLLLTRPDQARLSCMAYGPPLFVRKVSSMVPGVFSPSGSGPVEAVLLGRLVLALGGENP